MNPSRKRTFDRLLLAGVVLVYAALAARRLDVPVPGYDEAIYVPAALDILAMAAGGTPAGHWSGGAPPGRWPLMVMKYVGCPMSYFIAPFIGVWGLSVRTLRLPALGVALAAVLILIYLISKLFPRLPLWAPAGVCLLNSSFLITSRTGLYVDASIHWLLLSLTLLCLWSWSRTRRPRHAFLAFLCVGFGIYSKIIFVWFAIPAALAVAFASRRGSWEARARLAGLCALGLVIGSLPLTIYNLESRGRTAAIVLNHLVVPSGPGAASNLSFFQNLATRGRQFLTLFTDFEFASAPARSLSGASLLLLFAASFFLFRKRTQRAAVAAAGAFIAALLLGSTLTVSGRSVQHLYAVMPLMLVLSGAALAKLIPGRLPLLLACALLLLPQLSLFHAYLRDNERASDERSPRALNALSAYLSEAGVARPSALDWGLSYPLLVASGGKVAPRDDFGDPPGSLRPGGTAVCFWEPAAPRDGLAGCGRLLNDASYVLGDVRTFPNAPDAPVYAAIQVLGVR